MPGLSTNRTLLNSRTVSVTSPVTISTQLKECIGLLATIDHSRCGDFLHADRPIDVGSVQALLEAAHMFQCQSG